MHPSASSPAQRDRRHGHPRDAADPSALLAAVAVTRAAIFVLLLFLGSLAAVAAVTAAVVYEEGQNHQEGDNEGDGRYTGQNQQGLRERDGIKDNVSGGGGVEVV